MKTYLNKHGIYMCDYCCYFAFVAFVRLDRRVETISVVSQGCFVTGFPFRRLLTLAVQESSLSFLLLSKSAERGASSRSSSVSACSRSFVHRDLFSHMIFFIKLLMYCRNVRQLFFNIIDFILLNCLRCLRFMF